MRRAARLRRAGLLLIVVGCARGEAAKKIALRYHPPAGAVFHYTLEQHTHVGAPSSGPVGGLGKQDLSMRMYSTQAVKGPAPGGGTEVEIVIDSATMETPGMSPDAMAAQLARVRGQRSTVVFDERLQLLRTLSGFQTLPEVPSQIASLLQGPAYAFPEPPVGPGDSWTVSTALPIQQFAGAATSRADPAVSTLTVREIRVTGGDTSVVLDVKTTLPPGPIRLEIAGLPTTMKLSGDMGGYQEFSITRGTVIHATMQGTITISMTVTALGMRDLPMTSQTESTIQLVDAR